MIDDLQFNLLKFITSLKSFVVKAHESNHYLVVYIFYKWIWHPIC